MQAQREQNKDLFHFTTEFHIITVVLVHLKKIKLVHVSFGKSLFL